MNLNATAADQAPILSASGQSFQVVYREDAAKYDFARGASALVVFLAHAIATFWFRYIGEDHWLVTALGFSAHYAVLVFFLLSGFLITQSILANIGRHGAFDLVDYLCARIARIYPPFIGSILVIVVVDYVIKKLCLPGCVPYGLPGDLFIPRESFAFTRGEILSALGMRSGLLGPNGVLWSLYVEFNIYLIAMGVAGAITWKRPPVRLFGVLLAVGAILLGRPSNEHFIFFALIWLVGAAARLAREKLDTKFLRLVAAFLTVALAAAALYEPNLFSVNRYDVAALVIRAGACVSTAYFLFFVKWPVPYYFRPLVAVAPFSYSLYITHAPLLIFGLSLSQNWIQFSYLRSAAAMLTSAVLAMAMCMLLARVFEQTKYYKGILMDACLRNEVS